jgi:hypothetical protein
MPTATQGSALQLSLALATSCEGGHGNKESLCNKQMDVDEAERGSGRVTSHQGRISQVAWVAILVDIQGSTQLCRAVE